MVTAAVRTDVVQRHQALLDEPVELGRDLAFALRVGHGGVLHAHQRQQCYCHKTYQSHPQAPILHAQHHDDTDQQEQAARDPYQEL